MFRINPWHRRIIREEYIKGGMSFIFSLLTLIILLALAFITPKSIEIIKFEKGNIHDLGSDLLSAFVGVIGVAFAIAAIVFSILQMANKRIQINELIFKNSFFAPTFYFGIINIVILAYLELFHGQNEIFNSEFFLARLTVSSCYLFVIFSIAIIVVFYKVFRYLNFSNILNIYFDDTLELVRLEKGGTIGESGRQQISQRGREIFQEARDAIDNEENIFLERLLKMIETTFEINPTSNLLFGLSIELELWITQAITKKNRTVFYFLINFWRRLLVISANYPQSPSRAILLGLAAKIYKHLNGDEDV